MIVIIVDNFRLLMEDFTHTSDELLLWTSQYPVVNTASLRGLGLPHVKTWGIVSFLSNTRLCCRHILSRYSQELPNKAYDIFTRSFINMYSSPKRRYFYFVGVLSKD